MKQNLNPVAEAVLRILLEDGIEAAERYVADNLTTRAARAKEESERAAADEMAAKNIINLSRGLAAPVPTELPAQNDGAYDVAERRITVLRLAAGLGKSIGVVSTDDVQKALAEKGITIPGARPGTSIGNILFKDPDWVRVGEGKFKLREGAASS